MASKSNLTIRGRDGVAAWRRIAAAALGALLCVALVAPSGHAKAPLAVRLSALDLGGPGRVSFGVFIAGLDAGGAQTIEAHAEVGGVRIQQPPTTFPGTVDHFAVTLDLATGRTAIGAVAGADFPPIPPIGHNTPVSLEIVVRQGAETASGRRTGLLLLPVVVVPGYLNEIWGRRQGTLGIYRRRGYRDGGPAPNLFWFAYPSRSLTLEQTASQLSAYVRDVVLPRAYASRFNVVGYSAGGLSARWAAAFDPTWAHSLNRLFLVAVPNQGSVMAYVFGWYPAAKWARTPTARALLPTFPFWRPGPGAPWMIPRGAENVELARLNAQPLPEGIRVYAYYASRPPRGNDPSTQSGITGSLPGAAFSYGAGDGVTLAASVLGQPINGSREVPALAGRFAAEVNLGSLDHFSIFHLAMPKIADIAAAWPDGTDRTARTGRGGSTASRRSWESRGFASPWIEIRR